MVPSFYRVLLGFLRQYRVLLGFLRQYLVLLGFSTVLPSCTEFHRIDRFSFFFVHVEPSRKQSTIVTEFFLTEFRVFFLVFVNGSVDQSVPESSK